MPIDAKHPAYKANIGVWQRCRDTYEGEDAVKAAGQAYLPKCDPHQTPQEYDAYKARAAYFEAVGRTVDGFVGAVARKQHQVELPAGLADFEADVTADGVCLDEFIKVLAKETALMSRGGVLVDWDEKQNRAYLAFYQCEQIINWADDSVVLAETVYEPDPDDSFEMREVSQIRQLHLVNGRYTATIWRQTTNSAGSEWVIYKPLTPTKRGAPRGAIPFFWLSSMGRTSRYTRPPLLGLVNTALSHYRSSADLEHGRHFTGMPTLYVTGTSSDEPIRVGAAAAIKLADANAKVGYAEFVGQGLTSLENALDKKESQMAALGAAAFAEQKKAFESTAVVRMRMSGENSLLGSIVTAIEETLTAAIEYAAEWMDVAGTIKLAMNREFVDVNMDSQTLQGLVAAYQAGAMTLETFLFNMQQSDMLPPDTDIEKEAAEAEAQATKRATQAAALKAPPAKPSQSETD